MSDFRLILEDRGDTITGSYSSWDQDVPVNIDANVALERFMKENETFEVGVLPPVVRYIAPNRRQVILERPPQVVNIGHYGVRLERVKNAKRQEYTLNLPWTVYGIVLNAVGKPQDIYLYAAKHSIRSRQDVLQLLPLPNCDFLGKFCAPYHPEWMRSEPRWSLAESINAAYAQIWSSNFNHDMNIAVERAFIDRMPKPIFEDSGKKPINYRAKISPASLFKRWEEFSITDVVNFDWAPVTSASPFTVQHLIKQLVDIEAQYNSGFLFNRMRLKVM